ncbi:MFS transporter [Prosthecodimorpha staleyi]|uniref:MFS transporter n=1 Tax=Prosthecodimorpha staleyi TaxID=2840188 RepID=UPI0021C27310|nr:MFS transporter [Prosthecodimorpha staleyi]
MSAVAAADDAPPAARPAARLLIGLGGLYVAQSVIGGVVFTGLPAVMRQNGASLGDIAFILLTVLPWSFKFLWAPAVERFRSPHGGVRRTRTTVAIFGTLAVCAILATALIGPTALGPLTVAIMVASFSSATLDIACDGHAVESVAGRDRGLANAAQVGGAYLGSAIGGGLYLVLLDHFGWRPSTLAMAAVLLVLAAPFLTAPDGARIDRADRPRQSLRHALKRPAVRSGLLLVGLFVLGQKWAMVLIGPFLIDRGLSLSTIGTVNGIGITALGLAGALGGGVVLRRFSVLGVMSAALAVQGVVMFALAVFAASGDVAPAALVATTLVSSGSLALGFVALYSDLMGRASADQAGVDFTLFQSMDAIVSLIGWRLVGLFGDALGFAACFAGSGLLALLALGLLPIVAGRNRGETDGHG